jgi:hypothetical protein
MALVYIPTQQWSPIMRNFGNLLQILPNTSIHIANTDGSAATTYPAQNHSSPSTVDQSTDANGNLLRWIEEGEYDVTAGGVTARVEAVSATPSPTTRFESALGVGQNANVDLWFDASRLDQGLIAYDAFNRADSAVSLGTTSTGQAWTTGNGTLGVLSKQGYMPSGTTADATFDSRAAELAYVCDFTFGAAGGAINMILRHQDQTNRITVQIRKDVSNNFVQIVKTVAGVTTALTGNFFAATFVNGGTYRVEVQAKGSAYSLFVNDVSMGAAATDATNAFLTSTKVGFGFASSDLTSRINRLTVAPLTVADTDTVGAFGEATGYKAGVQATASKRPIYHTNVQNGMGSVRFDGTDDVLTSTGAADITDFTYLAVVSPTLGANRTIIGSDNTGAFQLRVNSDGTVEALSSSVASIGKTTDTVTAGQPVLLAFHYDALGNYAHYINGRPSAPNRILRAFTAGRLVSLGAVASATEPYSGDIFEVVRFTRVLKGGELRDAMAVLAQKWGITLKSRFPRTSSKVRSTVVKGSNIHPRATDLATANPWKSLWSAWPYTAWVKDSIDKAKGLGANLVRLIGDVEAVYDGTMTQSTYLTQLDQRVAYCQSIGVMAYPVGSDFRHLGHADAAFVRDFLVAQAGVLANYDNVYAFELVNELSSSFSTFGDRLAIGWFTQIATAVRAAAPNLPLSISEAGKSTGSWPQGERGGDYAHLSKIAPYVDILDAHLYDTTTRSADLAPLIALTDKPIMIGEFGIDRTGGSSAGDRATYYAAVMQLVADNPEIRGVIQWAIRNDKFGLYDETNGTLQSDIAPTWAAYHPYTLSTPRRQT